MPKAWWLLGRPVNPRIKSGEGDDNGEAVQGAPVMANPVIIVARPEISLAFDCMGLFRDFFSDCSLAPAGQALHGVIPRFSDSGPCRNAAAPLHGVVSRIFFHARRERPSTRGHARRSNPIGIVPRFLPGTFRSQIFSCTVFLGSPLSRQTRRCLAKLGLARVRVQPNRRWG
jgi:hypothetical protein